ncbi:MAG: hypothetical protein WEB57_05480 [Pseudohongiellaceae bacterium]
MNKRNLKGHIRQVMLAGMMTGASSVAFANDFSIEDDQFTLSGGGGFNETLEIAGDGTIDTPSDQVPQSGSFGMPDFSFDLTVADSSNGQHTFKVGVVIASADDSNRRIEAYLNDLVLDVNGDTVTGSIPAQKLLVVAQGDSLVATMALDNVSENGPVTISNSSVSFSGSKLVSRLRNADDNFDDLFTAFDQGGDYTYRVVIEQKTKDPTTIKDATFNTSSGDLKYDESTTDGDGLFSEVFNLTPDGETAPAFDSDEVYSVNGAFTVAATTTGGADDEDEEEELEDEASDVGNDADEIDIDEDADTVSDDVVDQVNNVAERASQTAQNVTNAISGGSSGLDVAATAVESVNKIFGKAATAQEKGGAVNRQTVGNALRNVGSLLGAVADRSSELTTEQRASISAQVKQTVQTSARLIADDASEDELTDIADSLTEILSNSARAGVELDAEFETQARGVAQRAASVTVRRQLGDALGDADPDDPDQLRQLLTDNPEARDAVLDVFPSIRSTIASSMANVQNPNGISIGGQTATQALLAALGLTGSNNEGLFGPGVSVQAATHGEPGIEVDGDTGIATITLANERYTGAVLSTKVAPDGMPEGLSFRRNGSAILVDGGLVIEIAPVAANTTGFESVLEDEGFSSELRNNGSIEIDLGDGELFSGAFAYNNQVNADGECSTVSITEPTGAANSAGHVFGVNCDNGVEQDVVPFPNSQDFFRAVRGSDLTVSADRDTGIVTVDGDQRFRPSFFVSPLTAEDATFREENAVQGVAFRAVDVNGDGLTDFQVIFENGVQVFYAVP